MSEAQKPATAKPDASAAAQSKPADATTEHKVIVKQGLWDATGKHCAMGEQCQLTALGARKAKAMNWIE